MSRSWSRAGLAVWECKQGGWSRRQEETRTTLNGSQMSPALAPAPDPWGFPEQRRAELR